MPEEAAEQQTETTDVHEDPVEQQETEPAGDGEETAEQQPQEGRKPAEPFDEARAQAKIRKANQEAANLRKRLKDLEPLAEEARQAKAAQQTEAERLQSQLAEREKELGALRKRAVKSEVRALAAATFADPTDPEAHLDLESYTTDDGDIDTDAVKADLADLLTRKPHLGKPKPTAEPEPKRRPAPDRTQASGANQTRAKDPADEFAGFVNSRLLKSKGR